MGEIQIIQGMIAKMGLQYFNPGTIHRVEVTHINNPKSFYVQLASLSEDIMLLEGRGNPINVEDIKIAKHVIYKSKTLNKYVRGVIECVLFKETSASCTVYALDYGCRDKRVSSKRIFLPEMDIDCPPMALHCQLHLCEPKELEFEEDVIDAMKFFIGKHTAKMTIIYRAVDKLTVELKTLECPDDVATTLGLLNFTTLTSYDNEVNRFQAATSKSKFVTYKAKNVKVGDKLCVRVQSGDTARGFYVADIRDYDRYIKDQPYFNKYCSLQNLQNVFAAQIDGRGCGVRVGEPPKFERAYVIKVTKPGAKALVKLIDWGKEIEVDFNDIKCVKVAAYTELPAIAMYCTSTEDQIFADGLDECSQFLIEILELGNGKDVPHKITMTRMDIPKDEQ
ncbi:unnamed protein product [Arctia plantaginis]|uniref:Tudor domain-containing protein n=1 Tax=Arctia plantaginis TaxID=874455 RepID=A0A8S0Z6N3_ARCPL|nr:unnamed protein product [Arctia plantaginis]